MKYSGHKRKRCIEEGMTFIALTLKGYNVIKEIISNTGIKHIEIDDDNEDEIMDLYNIPTVPCILSFLDGFQISTYIPKDYTIESFYNFIDKELTMPDISSIAHFQHIINNNNYTVFDFYSKECKPCNRIKEHLPDIMKDFPNCKFFKVPFNKYPSLRKQCGVEKMPTFVVYKDGIQKGLLQHSDPKIVSNFLKEITDPTSFITFEEDF